MYDTITNRRLYSMLELRLIAQLTDLTLAVAGSSDPWVSAQVEASQALLDEIRRGD
ncbi:MAG: hypothetical protein KGL39_52230 [Patescibacteria group bacterium]|nr:hypothetical protein [Patescibacteria group bacterium]